ncbi:SoxR reducing system RseC family protein [Eubacteriales bacterium OttesenSCG-928-A19]|nr:SoxR reducing system RseC family protein [Eubacteriales bacterium OttesenSCG-928-A19]
MVRTGEVVDRADGVLTVVFERPASCENCNGCLSKQCTNVELPGEAEVGDSVDVALPDKNVVGASAIAYVIPLVMLIAGMLLGSALHGPLGIEWNQDLFAAAAAGVSLGIGLLIVHIIDRRLRKRADWQPHIVAVRPAHEGQA